MIRVEAREVPEGWEAVDLHLEPVGRGGDGGRGQWEAEMGVGCGAGGAEGWCRLGEVRDEVDGTHGGVGA